MPPIFRTLESLGVAVAALDPSGLILCESTSFAQARRAKKAEELVSLFDCLRPVEIPFPLDDSGSFDLAALPYSGNCIALAPEKSNPAHIVHLRLDVWRNSEGDDSAPLILGSLGPAEKEHSGNGSVSLLRRYQPQIEVISDSFDFARIGAKVCDLLTDLTQAEAVGFYWLDSGLWRRAAQSGVFHHSNIMPEEFAAGGVWHEALEKTEFPSFTELAATRPEELAVPFGNIRPGQGFAMPCKARGDALGLALIFTRTNPADMADLLRLVAFEAAQAIDYARWFQFARQSGSQSEAFIDTANAIILGADLQHNVTRWNRKAQEVFGYTREEVIGRPISRIFSDEAVSRHLRQMLTSTAAHQALEFAMRDKEGRLHQIEWNTSPLTSAQGTTLGFYAIGQDVTRRNELERSLAASEHRYRSLVETTHDLYWTIRIDPDRAFESGTLSFINRSIGGHNRQAMLGQSLDRFSRVFTPESWKHFREVCLKVFLSGTPIRHVETTHISSEENGENTFLSSDIFPLLEDEIPVGVQGLSIDVTERKKIEEHMLQSQKMESIGTLARGVSHDFNNILNGISGFTYLIERALEGDKKILPHVHSIQQLAQRAGRLTRQLQTYASRESIQKRPLDLNEIIRQSSNILDAGISRDVELHLDLAPNLPWIEGDRSQIEQILLNLFLNATEAMESGGMLTIGTYRAERIEFPANSDLNAEACSVMTISDTGCGMTPETRARIFDPFFTTKKTGNGLGLSSVFGIVKRHGAFMEVESEPGAGTSFTFWFPAVDIDPALQSAEDAELVRGGSETILFVDDEPSIRMVSQDILAGLGYRVILAEDGEEAVRIYDGRPQAIDLVVLDVAMPILNGRSAAKIMRITRPDIRILFTSGHCDADMIESLREEGFPCFLAKPYSMADLKAAVRAALDTHVPIG